MTNAGLKLPKYLLDLCREFRKCPTTTEAMLWRCLRDRKLNGHKFRRQHAIGRYVVDFYCHELKLVIEIDGGIHWRREIQSSDKIRQRFLEEQGYSVVRVSAEDVKRNLRGVLMHLAVLISEQTVAHMQPSPPAPLPVGEGREQ